MHSRLGDLFGYEYGVLFGRARSGIAALLETLHAGRDFTFVLPSNICPVLFTTLAHCGVTPRLCPIDPLTGLAADATMAAIVGQCAGSGLVMPANLYGYNAPYPETLEAARDKGWFVLENDTMATKARLTASAPRTAFGDALLVSFGGGKTIDAGGGGAIVTDDKALAGELRKKAALYPPLDALAHAREEWILAFRLHLKTGYPGGPSMAGLNEDLMGAESANLYYGFPEPLLEKLSVALDGLEQRVFSRRERADYWKSKLSSLAGAVTQPALPQPSPWRVVCKIGGHRDRVAIRLRENGMDAGINYPPLTDSFPNLLADQTHADAERWGREVLNLWIEPDYAKARIDKAVAIMERALTEGRI